jgi:hypothetical protein
MRGAALNVSYEDSVKPTPEQRVSGGEASSKKTNHHPGGSSVAQDKTEQLRQDLARPPPADLYLLVARTVHGFPAEFTPLDRRKSAVLPGFEQNGDGNTVDTRVSIMWR